MKQLYLLSATTVALLLVSCVPSANPFYTEKDVVYESRLIGEWKPKERSESAEAWIFEQDEGKIYKLTVIEGGGKKGVFQARLFKLKQAYFLDLVPTDCQFADGQANIVDFAMFPGHLLLRAPQLGPELKLSLLDPDWLGQFLEKHPRALTHHYAKKDRLVLTAETPDLQRFLLKHIGEAELFGKPSEFIRKGG